MTTTARLLTLLCLTLPLGACAAQQAGAAGGQQAVAQDSGRAAAPAPAPVSVPAPAAPSAVATAPAQPRANVAAPAAPLTSTPVQETPAAPLTATPIQETPAVQGAPATAPLAAPPAAATGPGPVAMPASSPTGSLLQTLFALVAVLAVLAALAWFLKRYGPKAGAGGANLRIVGSLNLGGRERLLVVEVGSQWIVVGASPGRVNALATMPRQDGIDAAGADAPAALATHGPAAHSFADWLKQTIDKRK